MLFTFMQNCVSGGSFLESELVALDKRTHLKFKAPPSMDSTAGAFLNGHGIRGLAGRLCGKVGITETRQSTQQEISKSPEIFFMHVRKCERFFIECGPPFHSYDWKAANSSLTDFAEGARSLRNQQSSEHKTISGTLDRTFYHVQLMPALIMRVKIEISKN